MGLLARFHLHNSIIQKQGILNLLVLCDSWLDKTRTVCLEIGDFKCPVSVVAGSLTLTQQHFIILKQGILNLPLL